MISLLIGLSLTTAAPVPKDDRADREFRDKVDAARDKAIKYLREEQDRDGGWESSAVAMIAQKGGQTALVTLALLEGGVPGNDPTIAKAVEYLLAVKPEKTYVVSLQTQVLARADAKKHAERIQANADWLMKTAVMNGGKLRGWSYSQAVIADGSNTHFAVMGLHAAAQAGAKVDADIWRKVRNSYADAQLRDGGWSYWSENDKDTSTNMTVCGLLALAVATKYDKGAKGPDPAFEKGMAALLGGKHVLGEGKSTFVAWMAVAELGRALDATEFKSGKLVKPWYREGGEKLLKRQQENGSFQADEPRAGLGVDKQPVLATAGALYFFGPAAKK